MYRCSGLCIRVRFHAGRREYAAYIRYIISYVLRFSDKINRMKNPYGNFFIQSPSRNNFFTRGESVSSNQKSAVKMTLSVRNAFMLLLRLFNLHSQKFVDGIHKFTLVFSQTSYINHRKWCKVQVESSSRLSLKINPLKITYRNSRIKTLGQKPHETLAC